MSGDCHFARDRNVAPKIVDVTVDPMAAELKTLTQPEPARQLAEAAAQSKPEYREQIELFFGR